MRHNLLLKLSTALLSALLIAGCADHEDPPPQDNPEIGEPVEVEEEDEKVQEEEDGGAAENNEEGNPKDDSTQNKE